MRYINTSTLVVPTNWITLSNAERYNPVWSYLKVQFENLVGKKCWYNESINDGTSNPIDHFRPKASRVKTLTTKFAVLDTYVWTQLRSGNQSGYPFLEFEYSNYRYACGFANSQHKRESLDGITRGKSNFFPIKVGSNPSSDIAGIVSESAALLDPCNSEDPKLLTFNEIGGGEPVDSILLNSWDYCRVKVSIEVYNLMYHVISAKRQELWVETQRHIEMLSTLYNKVGKSPEDQQCFDHIFAILIKSLQKKAEYSAVVIDCINYYRKRKDPHQYRWLHDIMLNPLLCK
jgi:hypothetical protein